METVSINQYKGSQIEKGFIRDELSYEQIKTKLESNLEKGLISVELFDKAVFELDLVKGVDPSHGGTLKLTHIIDKNGVHRVMWRSPEEDKGDHKHVREVKEGDKLTINNQEHTVHKVKSDGYVTIKDSEGKKSDKSLNKVQFHPIHNEIGGTTEEPKKEEPKQEEPNGDTAVELKSFLDKNHSHFASFLSPKSFSTTLKDGILTIKPASGKFTIEVDTENKIIKTTGKPDFKHESVSYVEMMQIIKHRTKIKPENIISF